MKLHSFYSRYLGIAYCITALCLFGITATATAGDVEALYQAAGNGKPAEVAGLLERGVDANSRTKSGSYALNAAAVENEVDVIRILVDHKANPNVQNRQGDTPLICATKYAGGKAETVELLVKAGTDLSIRDNSGKTALDYARDKGQQEAIAIMERAGS